jgi:hypothetical protein
MIVHIRGVSSRPSFLPILVHVRQIYPIRRRYHTIIIPIPIVANATPATTTQCIRSVPLAPEAAILLITDVTPPTTSVQLALPHANPNRQQFPPSLCAQLLQPVAHCPPLTPASPVLVISAVRTSVPPPVEGPSGTTIVTPFERNVEDDAAAGQSVVAHCRSTRQHPGR